MQNYYIFEYALFSEPFLKYIKNLSRTVKVAKNWEIRAQSE